MVARALRSSLGEHLDAGVFHQREMTDLAVRDRKVMVEAHAQDQPLQPIGLLQVLVHLGLERGEGQTLTGKVQEEIGESGQGVFVPVSVRLDKPIKVRFGSLLISRSIRSIRTIFWFGSIVEGNTAISLSAGSNVEDACPRMFPCTEPLKKNSRRAANPSQRPYSSRSRRGEDRRRSPRS